jgi:formiminotetrahydrofolate cyclodeaminase
MIDQQTVTTFLSALAARTPSPGGGTCSALTGALATAQAAMCARYATDPERFAQTAAEALTLAERLDEDWKRWLELADRDAAAYLNWQAARKLPRDTAEQKKQRKNALERATEETIRIPEQMIESAEKVMQALARLSAIGNPNLAADLHVAAQGLLAAAEGDLIQVLGNLGAPMAGAALPERAQQARERIHRIAAMAKEIRQRVLQQMGWPSDT